MGSSLSQMFRSMGTVKCDCCGGTFIDEVGLMVIEDAVITYRSELRAKAREDDAAWSTARANVQAAVDKASS